ncbi:hypothetical protein EVAR_36786_1 [Eumeta japonica]|uniref:Uncharacterized protein n=1 Tax=Eumeta variegata TaxID=151549 RepID=A0A4C1WYQ8_EUMVA|nr:hypothetical protein EVAR_36786_1 [Eumeta japonica]
MRRKGVIIKKLLLGAIFPIWRRERQPYEVAKLKFGKSISKSIKLPIFKTPGKLSRKNFALVVCVESRYVVLVRNARWHRHRNRTRNETGIAIATGVETKIEGESARKQIRNLDKEFGMKRLALQLNTGLGWTRESSEMEIESET